MISDFSKADWQRRHGTYIATPTHTMIWNAECMWWETRSRYSGKRGVIPPDYLRYSDTQMRFAATRAAAAIENGEPFTLDDLKRWLA